MDTEAPRFLDFERWWGGFYLMNREEIEWITRNLFVGDKLWSGDVKASDDKPFDLRDIKAPIILFASMGDNITPPEQAFNWVADVYGSTEEIKARGQVIIGLVHEDVGHLGIFVSGKVAKKEHAQIVSVLKSVEMLPPGLYAMKIEERKGADGKPEYEVEFHERRLEDIVARINRFGRKDEKPFEAVAAVSEFNQRAYEMFARPVVQSMSNETTAKLGRDFHSLRFQRWAISDANPWLAWLAPAAEVVRAQRKAVGPEDPLRKAEGAMSELMSASLDYYRALRDATSEAAFFSTYGNMFSLSLGRGRSRGARCARRDRLARVALRQGSAGIDSRRRLCGGIRARGVPDGAQGRVLPLSRVVMRQELAKDYADLLPSLSPEHWRRIRGEQEIIARYEPDQAIDALPDLLADRADRERLFTLIERLLADKRVQQSKPDAGQMAMLDRIRTVMNDRPRRAEKARRRPALGVEMEKT